METFKFTPIDWTKIDTGNVCLCHSSGDILATLEIDLQRIEANKKGFPKDVALATHVWGVLKPKADMTISRSRGYLWWKETQTLNLKAWIPYVFEETPTGDQENDAQKKYGSSNNVQVLCRVEPLDEDDKKVLEASIIKNWQKSVTYGYLNFADQVLHVFGHDVSKKVIVGMEICSALWASIFNDVRRAKKQVLDFDNEANTNPFEWQISDKFKQDLNVQPLG